MSILVLRGSATGGGAGSFVDGAAGYAFAPPSGTANSVPYEFFGGSAGNIASGTNSSDVVKAGWSTAASGAPRYDNTYTYSRNKSLGFDARYRKAITPGNSGAFALGFDMGAAVSEYVFEGNVYFGHNTSPNLTAQQLKFHRLTTIDDITDGNTIYYTAHWLTAGVNGDGDFLAYPLGGLIENQAGGHTNGTNFFGSGGSFQHGERFPDVYPAWNTSGWYRYRFWGKPGTGTNTDDGQWTMDIWRLDTGAKVLTNFDINARTYVSASRGRWFELQMYHGNAAPGPPGGVDGTADGVNTFETPGDGYAYWDDVKLSYGANCQREIVGTNASTWAASTKWWFQPWTSWTSSLVTLTPNNPQGVITHLYEINASGVPVSTSGTPV
jgi:hypothetical protein